MAVKGYTPSMQAHADTLLARSSKWARGVRNSDGLAFVLFVGSQAGPDGQRVLMDRWIVQNLTRRGERVYRLPTRCPRCKSRDIIAEIRDGQVVEWCWQCDHNRLIRLIREEAVS
jgi:hypothetical protein